MTKSSLDEAFELAGTFGFLQIFVFVFNTIGGVAVMLQLVFMIFIGAKPEFECRVYQRIHDDNYSMDSNIQSYHPALVDNSETNHCFRGEQQCTEFHYTSNFTSIITEWDLVCQHAYQASFGQSVFMAGVLTGAGVFGPIADIFGRRNTYFFTLLAAMLSALGSGFCPDLYSFLVLRFFTGFFCAGAMLSSFVLLQEIVGISWRAFCCLLSPIIGSLGIALMSVLSYFIPDWRKLSSLYTVVGFVMLPLFFLVPESPRWLYGRNRVVEAEQLLMQFARRNGKTDIGEIHLYSPQESHNTAASSFTLFKDFALLEVALIQFFSWFVNCVVYYGQTMGAGDLGGNLYVSTFLSGIIEIPAYLLSLLLLKFIGRRTCYCGFMLTGGVASLCIMVVPLGKTYIVNGIALFSKMCITASFQIIYLWSGEIFPTVVRNSALGLMNVGARIGGIISPFINLLHDTAPVLPYLVFGVLCIISGIFNIFLPETRNKALPQTIYDLRRLCGKAVIPGTHSDSVNVDEQSVELLEYEEGMGERSGDDDELEKEDTT